MVFAAGMGGYDLTEFGVWEGEGPRGWVEVGLGGGGCCDGDRDGCRGRGDVLRAMLVQVRVCENHQNGKDTHVRGLQIFARDERGQNGHEGNGIDINNDDHVAVGERTRGAKNSRGKVSGKKDRGRRSAGAGLSSTLDSVLTLGPGSGAEVPDWMADPELR